MHSFHNEIFVKTPGGQPKDFNVLTAQFYRNNSQAIHFGRIFALLPGRAAKAFRHAEGGGNISGDSPVS